MNSRPRRNHSLAFKAKGALAAIRGEKALAGSADHLDVHPIQIHAMGGSQLINGAAGVFGVGATARRVRL